LDTLGEFGRARENVGVSNVEGEPSAPLCVGSTSGDTGLGSTGNVTGYSSAASSTAESPSALFSAESPATFGEYAPDDSACSHQAAAGPHFYY